MRVIGRGDFMKKIGIALVAALMVTLVLSCVSASGSDLPAFPGAEGGGKYTTGARGGSGIEVYHVTNLNDSGTGSLRDAVKSKNGSKGRIVVFDVGGVIKLKSTLSVKRGNITILGQTAPGDGITLAGNDLVLDENVDNVIIRYLRVRPTDKNGGEPDGLGGRWNDNIMIDHCSVSWSVDEGLTLYGGDIIAGTKSTNVTMQYCLGSESLKMSNHFKGAHGYGAIWGGTLASYHHNLLAHHDSRSPRLDRNLQGTDVRNNVIYNWGVTNSAYGGEPDSTGQYSNGDKNYTETYVNWANNYHKYGPATSSGLKTRIFDAPSSVTSGGKTYKSNFYFNGNYVFGSSSVTNSNLLGVRNNNYLNLLSAPFDMGDYTIPEQTAEDTYEDVLANVGATLPKRDSIDARVIADVKNQTGRIVNQEEEVGGVIEFDSVTRKFEIPSDWKTSNGMGSSAETDIVKSGEWSGYTWIEAYVNDWTEQMSVNPPTNPEIIVTSPAIASVKSEINGVKVNNGNWAVIKDNEELKYSAQASSVGNTVITKMELYDGTKLIKSYNSAEINDSIPLDVGVHYLACMAYNDAGESTRSVTSIVYVNHAEASDGWTVKEIGSTAYPGQSGGGVENGVVTIGGSGKMRGVKTDSCAFMYKKVSGDFEITARIGNIPKNENGALAGLMMRESLDSGSRMVFLGDGWLKYGENIQVLSRTAAGASTAEYSTNIGNMNVYLNDKDGNAVKNSDAYTTWEYPMPKYMKISRVGDTVTVAVSNDGYSFTSNVRQPKTYTFSGLSDEVYIGFAADSHMDGTDAAPKPYYSMASFKEVTLTGENIEQPSPTPKPESTQIFHDEIYEAPPWYFSSEKIVDKDMAAGAYPSDDNQMKSDGHVLVVNLMDGYASRTINGADGYGKLEFTFDYITKGKDGRDACDFEVFNTSPQDVMAEAIYKLSFNEGKALEINNNAAEGDLSGIIKDNWYNITVTFDYKNKDKNPNSWITTTVKEYSNYANGVFGNTLTAKSGAMAEGDIFGARFYSQMNCAKYVGDFKLDASEPLEASPTDSPTEVPTEIPTETPTETPTEKPTEIPTASPEPGYLGQGFAEKPVLENGKLNASVNNHTKSEENIIYLIASYDESGILTDAHYITVKYSPQTQNYSIDVKTEEGGKVKTFLWHENLQPIQMFEID